MTGLRTPIAISVSGSCDSTVVPSPSDSRHGNTVSMPPASMSSGRILTNGAAGLPVARAQVDGLALEPRGPTRRPQHRLLAVGGLHHRLPRVLDQAAGERHQGAEAERAEADAQREADQLAALDRRALQRVGQVGHHGPAVNLGGGAVVAVLDRDLLGDELLLVTAPRRCRSRGSTARTSARTAVWPGCTGTRPREPCGLNSHGQNRNTSSSARPEIRPAEASTPPRARPASRPWCPRPASGRP